MDKKEWLKKFSHILRTKLDEKNISYYKFNNGLINFSTSVYSYINGESIPSAYTIGAIAKGLGCTTDELIMFDDIYDDEYFELKDKRVVEVPTNIKSNITVAKWKKLFGQNLYNRMVEQGLNQTELAIRSNINANSVNNYVNGIMIPNGWRLVNLAKALNCTVDDLVDFGSMVIDCR